MKDNADLRTSSLASLPTGQHVAKFRFRRVQVDEKVSFILQQQVIIGEYKTKNA